MGGALFGVCLILLKRSCFVRVDPLRSLVSLRYRESNLLCVGLTKMIKSSRVFLLSFILYSLLAGSIFAQEGQFVVPKDVARDQWTVQESKEWHRNVGVIKGFNALKQAHPGMSRDDIMDKAVELGFNSVRIFLPGNNDLERVRGFLRELLEDADARGLKVSPVLNISKMNREAPQERARALAKRYVQGVVYEFREDPRIDIWDVCNEPTRPKDVALAKDAILWAREVGPVHPITVSAYYWVVFQEDNSPERRELASMNDIHNFHSYFYSWKEMQGLEMMVKLMKEISDRPMICSEWLSRSQGDSFGRILPYFAKYQIHWQSWGMFVNDANWHVLWRESSFDPNDAWFHEIFHPDGNPYDYRDLDLIRNFSFSDAGDPGIEKTDRWLKERAWRYSFLGPEKGWTYLPSNVDSPQEMWRAGDVGQQVWSDDLKRLKRVGCDGLRVYLDIDVWNSDPEVFIEKMDTFLTLAESYGMTVTPVLMTDEKAGTSLEKVAEYTRSLVKKFGRDSRIFCWELYDCPGGGGLKQKSARELLLTLFRAARFEFPGQPLTATPAVTVKEIPEDYDYRRALTHGGKMGSNGWNRLIAAKGTDLSLCAFIWSLSDVIAVRSEQAMVETGWLISVANRYGRPVLCLDWSAPDLNSARETMDHFGKHFVRWYAGQGRTGGNGDGLKGKGLFDATVLSEEPELQEYLNAFHYTRFPTKRKHFD